MFPIFFKTHGILWNKIMTINTWWLTILNGVDHQMSLNSHDTPVCVVIITNVCHQFAGEGRGGQGRESVFTPIKSRHPTDGMFCTVISFFFIILSFSFVGAGRRGGGKSLYLLNWQYYWYMYDAITTVDFTDSNRDIKSCTLIQ